MYNSKQSEEKFQPQHLYIEQYPVPLKKRKEKKKEKDSYSFGQEESKGERGVIVIDIL